MDNKEIGERETAIRGLADALLNFAMVELLLVRLQVQNLEARKLAMELDVVEQVCRRAYCLN